MSASSKRPDVVIEDLRALRTASDCVRTAAQVLPSAIACFDEAGELTAEPADLAAAVHAAIGAIKRASNALFGTRSADRAFDAVTQPLLDSLWGTADIVMTAHAAIAAGAFPDGEGMTVSPIQGALEVALERLETLEVSVGGASDWAIATLLQQQRGDAHTPETCGAPHVAQPSAGEEAAAH